MCRKHISSNPVHSLALDNAITKLEEKMDEEERKERQEVKEDRQPKKEAKAKAKVLQDKASSVSYNPSKFISFWQFCISA